MGDGKSGDSVHIEKTRLLRMHGIKKMGGKDIEIWSNVERE